MSEPVGRAADAAAATVQDVRVYHRRAHVLMAKQFLNRADIVAIFEQVGGKRMAQRMGRGMLRDAGPADGRFDRSLNNRLIQMVALWTET